MTGSSKHRSPGPGPSTLGWILLPLTWLAVAAVVAFLAIYFESWLPAIVGGVLVAVVALWVLGCTFSPAIPDRKCPRCGAEDGLVRPDKSKMLGVKCRRCGYENQNLYRAYLDEV